MSEVNSQVATVRKVEVSFCEPSGVPTQNGPHGIQYDFNHGCRVLVPAVTGKSWLIRLKDVVTDNILFETRMESGFVESTKKYFVPFKIECLLDDELVFEHTMALDGKKVQIQYPVGTLGDVLGWFPYAELFQRKHNCKLSCVIAEPLLPLFSNDEYPDIEFVSPKDAEQAQDTLYATYRMGLFFDDWNCVRQPVDFRYVGLHKTAAYILDVPSEDIPTRIALGEYKREIEEPYVCIAVQSSTQCKYWNNPHGWIGLVKWLKELGYRVVCIDKDPVWGTGTSWNWIPNGAEDFTGNISLLERARLLKHCDFFVGLSSGLAWLAWSVGVPTVMISGFTHPNNEFYTPYRVFNHHTCNSCWNDPKCMFDHGDFMWCPRHKGTDRQFECTRLITLNHVKSIIDTIPAVHLISQYKAQADKDILDFKFINVVESAPSSEALL